MRSESAVSTILAISFVLGALLVFPLDTSGAGVGMDFDLKDAHNSFWGEDPFDYSGIAISNNGDVNGDGYDDIVIGAWGDEDGGLTAGQTYLILGKASGWSVDAGLSNADASFWGEDAGDYSGFEVAGAGDVNGDGYDDILIGAYGDDDGGSNA
ncbi:MAG: FG-GAP repeat protein, partial [Thermoplasmata archaeon]|nr:FG-GAP repeat protein [Thermoplasmata archaeon]